MDCLTDSSTVSLSFDTSERPFTTSTESTTTFTSSESTPTCLSQTLSSNQVTPSKNQLKRERKRKYREKKKIGRKLLKKKNRKNQNISPPQSKNEVDDECQSKQIPGSNGEENVLKIKPNEKSKEHVKKQRSVIRRKRFNNVVERLNSPYLVIDCSYTSLQTQKEVQSLAQQLMLAYAANRASTTPFRLAITSVNEQTKTCLNKITGWNNWNCLKDERHFIELFEKNNIIYLSADSEYVIDSIGVTESRIYHNSASDTISTISSRPNYITLPIERSLLITGEHPHTMPPPDATITCMNEISPSTSIVSNGMTADGDLRGETKGEYVRSLMVYVIGGIVDRNRLKGLCYKDSVDRNIRTARLPITEYLSKPNSVFPCVDVPVDEGSSNSAVSESSNQPSPASLHVDRCTFVTGSKVLTIDQVVAMLLKYRETKDWCTAIHQAIPERKMIKKQKSTSDLNKSLIPVTENTD